MTAADWAQIASATFTALTAFAALATVLRVERDRWRQTMPALHIEAVADVPNQQMRLTVINHGGPAREVRVLGTIGDFGFAGSTPPSTYWKSGEVRTYSISMALTTDQEVLAFVEARDLAKKRLLIRTAGGYEQNLSLRKARKLSAEREWHLLFPGKPLPLDVPYAPMKLELLDRTS